MPRPRQQKCGASLHDLTDPENVRTWVDSASGQIRRGCKPCQKISRAKWRKLKALNVKKEAQLEWRGPVKLSRDGHSRRHREAGLTLRRPQNGPMRYQASAEELSALQELAYGWTPTQLSYRDGYCKATMNTRLKRLGEKWGVPPYNRVALVAQGLKRGAITPDFATAKRLRKIEGTTGTPGAPFRRSAAHNYIRHRARPTIAGDMKMYPSQGGPEQAAVLWDLQAHTEVHVISILWAARIITSRDVPQTRYMYKSRRKRLEASRERSQGQYP